MMVHDLDIMSITVSPNEAQAPFIVDTDTVLSRSVIRQGFEPIPWRVSRSSMRTYRQEARTLLDHRTEAFLD